MTATAPTILATSGGLTSGDRIMLHFAPLVHEAVCLAQVTGRAPRIAYLGTALGDQEWFARRALEAGADAGYEVTEIRLFPMPNHESVRDVLLASDVVWVMGGSVANLLAVWGVHELGSALREAWQAGVVLTGVSAGSICWFRGGTTDSFGPMLRPVTNGLGFLPYGNGVHYDSEERRRPLVHRLVAEGVFDEVHCTDDGVGLLYRGTELVEAVSERDGAGAYVVTRDPGGAAIERRIEPRLLPGAD